VARRARWGGRACAGRQGRPASAAPVSGTAATEVPTGTNPDANPLKAPGAGTRPARGETPILASIGLRDVLDAAPDLIFACDAAGRFLWLNLAAETLCGRSRVQLVGRKFIAVLPGYDRRRVLLAIGKEPPTGAVVTALEVPIEARGGAIV